MKILTKEVVVNRGNNIGKAIIDSFHNYNKIVIKSIDVSRDAVNRVNTASLTYTFK